MIINLTQHSCSVEQIEAGVVEPTLEQKREIRKLLTFDELPTSEEIKHRAKALADLAEGNQEALIGGALFLMSSLEKALCRKGILPLYAFSRRESVEEELPNGKGIKKIQVFRHLGFVIVIQLTKSRERKTIRTEQEIEKMLDKAAEHTYENKWPGMTYELGVREALDWVLEYEDVDPTTGQRYKKGEYK